MIEPLKSLNRGKKARAKAPSPVSTSLYFPVEQGFLKAETVLDPDYVQPLNLVIGDYTSFARMPGIAGSFVSVDLSPGTSPLSPGADYVHQASSKPQAYRLSLPLTKSSQPNAIPADFKAFPMQPPSRRSVDLSGHPDLVVSIWVIGRALRAACSVSCASGLGH